jgi:hypothetical protein
MNNIIMKPGSETLGNVFTNNMLIEPIVDDFGFSYNTGTEIIKLK